MSATLISGMDCDCLAGKTWILHISGEVWAFFV